MNTINNRYSLPLCLFLVLALPLWAGEDELLSIELPSAVLLNETETDTHITISGKTNLPAGTIIRIILSAKTSSLVGHRFELINAFRVIIDKSGKWRHEIKPITEMPFWAESYKIEIGTEVKTICCKYFSIASPLASKQRQQEIYSLYQNVTELWNLDRELNDSINSIENIKQGKTGWERNIQKTLGIYNSPEEALALAIKKWREWEPGYTRKLETLSASLQVRTSLSNFITVQEQLSYLSACLYERYAQYRSQLLGSPRRISYHPIGQALLNPADNRNNTLSIMEREIVSKIFQDSLSLMEHLDKNYLTAGTRWQKSRSESLKLCANLKNELEYYYRMGLFYRQPNKNLLKESQYLSELVDTLSLLLDKLIIVDDKNMSSEEIKTIVTSLHNKITFLSAEIY